MEKKKADEWWVGAPAGEKVFVYTIMGYVGAMKREQKLEVVFNVRSFTPTMRGEPRP